jgi:uncharacterized membrane protein YphA (DoxX/SURF4 family)
MTHTLGVIAAAVLGGAFVFAGAAKLAMGRAWIDQARSFGVPWQFGQFVPWWELVVGALLVVQIERRILAGIAIATLVVFSTLVASQLARGRRPVCACFGAWSPKPIGPPTLVRNAALVALGLVAALA